jgi:excisionase family DNA binding protein
MGGAGISYRDVHGIADELSVDVQTVRRWIQSGKLRAFKPGKEYRVRETDLEEFLAAREVRPKAITSPSQRSLFNGDEEEERRVEATGDPVEAAAMIRSLGSTAAELAGAWNQDVEFYEQHGRGLLPYRTLEMGLAVEGLYRRFWGALSVLQHQAQSLGLDPNPATWEPQSKHLLIEAGSNIRALAELYALIDKTGRESGADREDSRAMRKEFDMGAAAVLADDPQWPEAMKRARAAAGIA